MTLLFQDGFDFNDQQDAWTFGIGAGAMNTTNPRTGPRCCNIGASQYFYRALQVGVDDDDGVTMGSAMLAASTDGAAHSHWQVFAEDTTRHIEVSFYNASRSIRIYRGGISIAPTLLAESAANLWTYDTWHHLESKVKIADSGGTVEVRLNGATVLSFTGDTKAGGAGLVNRMGFEGAFSAQVRKIDDVHMLNEVDATATQGRANNAFLGDVRAWPKLPNGNGNYSQLLGSDGNSTDNYLLIDEAGTPSMTDYVGSATAGQKDTYTFEDLDAASGTIFGVEIRMFAAKTEIGNKGIRALTRRGSDVAGTDFALATTEATYRQLYGLDPVAAAVWTISNFDSTEFGAEVRDI